MPDEVAVWVERALGSSSQPKGYPDVHFRALGRYSSSHMTLAQYHHAVDEREAQLIAAPVEQSGDVRVAIVKGRHVGALGPLLPTGRRFTTVVHMIAHPDRCHIFSSLPSALFRDGVRSLRPGAPAAPAQLPPAISFAELLEGDIQATRWAKAWRLSERLAQVALLLMAGASIDTIAKQFELTAKSVRTYAERLFRLARVDARGQLPLAALKAAGMQE